MSETKANRARTELPVEALEAFAGVRGRVQSAAAEFPRPISLRDASLQIARFKKVPARPKK